MPCYCQTFNGVRASLNIVLNTWAGVTVPFNKGRFKCVFCFGRLFSREAKSALFVLGNLVDAEIFWAPFLFLFFQRLNSLVIVDLG